LHQISRMRKIVTLLVFLAVAQWASAQKVESIVFNLYTDSLKKGFYNYISIDGKFSDGTWQPLDSSQIQFTANTGHFKGNDLFIDSTYKADSIIVKATLRANPAIWKETVIYIRKRGFDEPLKTNDELFEEMRQQQRKKRSVRNA
jgi:hypothetical protein